LIVLEALLSIPLIFYYSVQFSPDIFIMKFIYFLPPRKLNFKKRGKRKRERKKRDEREEK
jgi:hypothetical protein